MIDPRAENCRSFRLDARGKVTGVELGVEERPQATFRLLMVRLIDEDEAGGQTVAHCQVLDRQGLPTGKPVWLAYPWPNLSNFLLPGNPAGDHVIVNSYQPPEVGPLALVVCDQQGKIDSDILYGLGLPMGHHVSYQVIFQERAKAGEVIEQEDIKAILLRIEEELRQLARHLGAR